MLGFDYQRMSQSGQQVYDSIYKTLHKTLDKQDYDNEEYYSIELKLIN